MPSRAVALLDDAIMIMMYATPSTDLLAPGEEAGEPFLTSKLATAISLVALCCLQSIPPGVHLPHAGRALPPVLRRSGKT